MGVVWKAPRLWPGGRVVVAASGPSLTQEQLDHVRGKARVIAVNDAYKLAPWADVFYAADSKWWDVHWPQVGRLPGLKVCAQASVVYGDVKVICHDDTGEKIKFDDPSGLHGNNSGAEAVHLAYHMTGTAPLLLGCDCTRGPENKAHFFGDHPTGLRNSGDPRSYAKGFEHVARELEKRGIQAVNCSAISALTCFPKVRLEDAL